MFIANLWSFKWVGPPKSLTTGGSNSFIPPSALPLSSPLLNADVLLAAAYKSAKMFNFGSKLLLLFLLVFPCGLISIGKSDFSAFEADGVSRYLHFGNSWKVLDSFTYWRGIVTELHTDGFASSTPLYLHKYLNVLSVIVSTVVRKLYLCFFFLLLLNEWKWSSSLLQLSLRLSNSLIHIMQSFLNSRFDVKTWFNQSH